MKPRPIVLIGAITLSVLVLPVCDALLFPGLFVTVNTEVRELDQFDVERMEIDPTEADGYRLVVYTFAVKNKSLLRARALNCAVQLDPGFAVSLVDSHVDNQHAFEIVMSVAPFSNLNPKVTYLVQGYSDEVEAAAMRNRFTISWVKRFFAEKAYGMEVLP